MNSHKIIVVSSLAAGLVATRPRSLAAIGRGEALHRGIVVSQELKLELEQLELEQLEREHDPRYFAPLTRRERRKLLREVGRTAGKLA